MKEVIFHAPIDASDEVKDACRFIVIDLDKNSSKWKVEEEEIRSTYSDVLLSVSASDYVYFSQDKECYDLKIDLKQWNPAKIARVSKVNILVKFLIYW